MKREKQHVHSLRDSKAGHYISESDGVPSTALRTHAWVYVLIFGASVALQKWKASVRVAVDLIRVKPLRLHDFVQTVLECTLLGQTLRFTASGHQP